MVLPVKWMEFSLKWKRKHHIVIGASSLVAMLSILIVLVISGKSRKAVANSPGVIEITMPDQSQMRYLAELQAYNNLHVASLSSSENSEQADDVGEVRQVGDSEKIMVLGGGDETQRHQQTKNAEIFFH